MNKFKIKNTDWDELEKQSLKRQALPIDESESISTLSIPLTGHQYILKVRTEASAVPDIMTCNLKQNSLPPVKDEFKHEMVKWGIQEKVVKDNILNSVWIHEFTRDFKRLKSHLNEYWSRSSPESSDKALPKDECNWYKALYNEKTISPTLSTLSQINHPTSLMLIQYHLKWLKNNEIRQNQGIWLFSCLLRLDPLLTSDQISILRDLSRRCIHIRDNCIPFSMNFIMASILITIISQVFGQKDLY